MPLTKQQMLQIMLENPDVDLVYNDHDTTLGTFHVQTSKRITHHDLRLPEDVDPTKCTIRKAPPFHTLELQRVHIGHINTFNECQDEPIKLGTQIQPQGAPWVGTAGCPVSWTDLNMERHWGILSNWHVFCGGRYDVGHPQHQPTDDRPACAHLFAATPVDAAKPNNTDAAITDALVDGFHSIDWSILDIGRLNPTISRAAVGGYYRKVGRTTGLTHARCTAINVTARIGYGDFEAIFIEQDLFEDVEGSFSAPGDSGSTIVCDCNGGPSSLLFAGGGNQTLGNPIQLVTDKLNLRFDP